MIGHRCPRCKSRKVRLFESAGVWFMCAPRKLQQDECGVTTLKQPYAAVVGIPTVACLAPGCLWARPANDTIAGTAELLLYSPPEQGREWVRRYNQERKKN